jgi:hypothetical protein
LDFIEKYGTDGVDIGKQALKENRKNINWDDIFRLGVSRKTSGWL